MKNDLTASYVRELFDYDTKTGNLIWKVTKCNRGIAGSVAGCIHPNGYRLISIDSSNYRAHRLVWLHHYGEWPEEFLDHINGVKTDNRLSNLRLATAVINLRNQKLRKTNSSGVCGVRWHKASNKWVATIHVNGKENHLGLFENKEDAIAARKQAEFEYGFHPNHGQTEKKRALTV